MFKQFSLLLAIVFGASADVASAQQWGDLDGTFVYKGTPPAPMKITPEKDPEYCGKHPLVVENLVVNKENGGMANVVIYLFTAQGAKVEVQIGRGCGIPCIGDELSRRGVIGPSWVFTVYARLHGDLRR